MYKIMIIEDDITIAKTIAEHLSKWDYDVYYVTDFKNIIEQFVQFEPQLVLLDVMLPFFNGFHWCSEIRKISVYQGLPVLIGLLFKIVRLSRKLTFRTT
jgi:two-component system response regulator protein BraR/BceR